MLSLLTDHNRYPGNAISELYQHRWEIELGYRKTKQGMLNSRWTLRSRLPELVRQERWGVLLMYNLVRYQMVRMAFHLKGNYLPYQLSLSGAYNPTADNAQPLASPRKISGELRSLYEHAKWLITGQEGEKLSTRGQDKSEKIS